MKRIIAAAAVALCFTSISAFAASAGEVRYRVTIRDTEVAPVEEIAASLAGTYGGEVSSGDISGRSFVILTTPARAKLMLENRSVARIESLSAGSNAHAPRMTTNTQVDLGTYLYDGSGNIRTIDIDNYVYDKVSRVKTATVSSVSQSYNYDGFGNLNTITTGAGVLCAGQVVCGRALTISSQTNHITSDNAHYTDAGSLDSLDSYTYTYDDLGMMTQQRIGTAIVRQFVYTTDDERLATYVPSGVWNWTVRDLSGAVLRTFTSQDSGSNLAAANWQWNEDYIYRGSLLLATKGAQGVRHLHLDHLGSPRLITDDSGHQTGIHKYLPFGAELNVGTRENPEETRKFTGHERDGLNVASTLDYMHARYYGWGMGRFLSFDPEMDVKLAVRPQKWNRYIYGANNPISVIDRNGRGDTDLRCNPYTECKTPETRAAFEEGKDRVFKIAAAAVAAAAVVIYAPPLARFLFSWAITHPNEATQIAGDIVSPPGPSPFIPGPVNSQFGKLDYLLGEVPGSAKSAGLGGFFKGELGFSKETERLLGDALRSQFAANFTKAVVNEKGMYEVTGEIIGANGKTAVIRTVWEKISEDTYKFVTSVPSH
jgi:RHS repeat-associated protein